MSISEDRLRRAKDGLVEKLSEQQRQGGIKGLPVDQDHSAFAGSTVPDVAAIESYIDPILSKLDRTTSEQSLRAQEDEAEAAAPRQRATDVDEHAGIYDWNLRTDEITAWQGSWMPNAREMLRLMVARLMRMPEWAGKLRTAMDRCKRHPLGRVSHCKPCERREEAYRAVIAKAVRKFGNPNKPVDKRIVVGG